MLASSSESILPRMRYLRHRIRLWLPAWEGEERGRERGREREGVERRAGRRRERGGGGSEMTEKEVADTPPPVPTQ